MPDAMLGYEQLSSMEPSDSLLHTFVSCRAAMMTAAARILGSREEAEDVVQEAWFRWVRTDAGSVRDPRGFLTRTASRLALDRLRRGAVRHDAAMRSQQSEPSGSGTPAEPAHLVEVAEAVTTAMVLVLKTLSPLERLVFVLHEAFDYSYADIAEMLNRTSVAVRQAAHRAREHVAARRNRYLSDPFVCRAVADQFIAASSDGDLPSLIELLSPRSVRWSPGRPGEERGGPDSPRHGHLTAFSASSARDWLRLADEFTESFLHELGGSPTLASGRRAAYSVANWVCGRPEQARVLHLLNQLEAKWPWPEQVLTRAEAVRERLTDGLLHFGSAVGLDADPRRAQTILLEVPYASARRELVAGRSATRASAVDHCFAVLLRES